MRPHVLPLLLAALCFAPEISACDQIPAAPLTLEKAWQCAQMSHPGLRRAQAQLDAADGELGDAAAPLWHNPTLTGERTRRTGPASAGVLESQREWQLGLEQSFELAGQQGHRRRAALRHRDAQVATIEQTRRDLHAEVERRFVQLLSLQERIAAERLCLASVEEAATLVAKRVAAGEDSRLDGNLALVEAARASNRIGVLEEQQIDARAELATTLQLPLDAVPAVSGDLLATQAGHTLDQLLRGAATRPQASALGAGEAAAAARLALEKAARYPDLTVGIVRAREGATGARERLTGLTLSLPLPLFRRNGAAIGRASADLATARIEREADLRDSGATVTQLWQKRQSLNRRLASLQQTVLPALEQSQRLSLTALRAGEIGLPQLLLLNRQVLDGRGDVIDAQTELRLAQVALHHAAGLTE